MQAPPGIEFGMAAAAPWFYRLFRLVMIVRSIKHLRLWLLSTITAVAIRVNETDFSRVFLPGGGCVVGHI